MPKIIKTFVVEIETNSEVSYYKFLSLGKVLMYNQSCKIWFSFSRHEVEEKNGKFFLFFYGAEHMKHNDVIKNSDIVFVVDDQGGRHKGIFRSYHITKTIRLTSDSPVKASNMDSVRSVAAPHNHMMPVDSAKRKTFSYNPNFRTRKVPNYTMDNQKW